MNDGKTSAILSRGALQILVAVLVFFGPAGVTAQAVLEEITVTAQKREQNLQDVGISVTAFTGEQIRDIGFFNTVDIAQQVPNFNVIQFHPTTTNLNIRGVTQTSFANHLEPPIALYVDEAYVSSMGAAHAQLFDMERVEVLRGPQGTLFGRNAKQNSCGDATYWALLLQRVEAYIDRCPTAEAG